jgi:hypothetical protein
MVRLIRLRPKTEPLVVIDSVDSFTQVRGQYERQPTPVGKLATSDNPALSRYPLSRSWTMEFILEFERLRREKDRMHKPFDQYRQDVSAGPFLTANHLTNRVYL